MDELHRLAAFLFGFAPRSALTCSIEGDPPGGGGTPPATPPAPPAPATPAAPVVTPEVQALINQAAQAAHNAAWKQARETFETKQGKPGAPQPPPKPTETNAPATPPDFVSLMKLRDDFDDAIGDLTLTGAQKKFLREHVMEKRPDDVGGYLRTFTETLGVGKQPSTPVAPVATTTPPGAPAPATGPHITERPVPPASHVVTEDTPILSLSLADREALRSKLGDIAYAERFRRELKEKQVRVRSRA